MSRPVLCFYPLEADARDRLRSLSPALDIAYTEPDAQSLIASLTRAAIAALAPHAVLVNVARGRVLDEEALRLALQRGRLRGAVLDVATAEPVPSGSARWGAPNLLLTPHVSAIQDPSGWWGLVAGLMSENLARYARGRELLNVVDGAAGY